MLNKFRNFSGTLFAKVFLIIVAIPFIFWGMGDLFSGGNQNTIVKIDDKKISTQKFINYIKNYSDPNQKLDSKAIEKLLADFIGEELLRREVKKFNISISDNSLAAIIRNQKILVSNRLPYQCISAFENNNIFGLIIFFGLLLSYLYE